MKKFRLADTDAIQLLSTGSLALKTDPDSIDVKGTFSVDEATCDLSAMNLGVKTLDYKDANTPAEETEPTKRSKAKRDVTVDLSFHCDRNLQVVARVLRSTWSGDVTYRLSKGVQSLTGGLNIWKGNLDLLGIRFDFSGGNITLTDTFPPNPNLEIEAVTQRHGIEATVGLTGPVSDPQLEFRSHPSMHEDEILSHLLFGKSLSEISAGQVLLLAAELQKLRNPSSSLGFKDNALALLNIDYIDFRGDGDESEIAVGKQLSENLHTEVRSNLQTDTAQGTVIRMEYELRHNISAETEFGNADDSHIGINWKRDY